MHEPKFIETVVPDVPKLPILSVLLDIETSGPALVVVLVLPVQMSMRAVENLESEQDFIRNSFFKSFTQLKQICP